MRYNPHAPAIHQPITGHADLADRLARIRQAERTLGQKLPNTTEALLRLWEQEQTDGR